MGEKKESSISFSYARKLISCKTHIQKPCVGNMKQRTHAVNKDCVHDVSYCWGPYKPMIMGVNWFNDFNGINPVVFHFLLAIYSGYRSMKTSLICQDLFTYEL